MTDQYYERQENIRTNHKSCQAKKGWTQAELAEKAGIHWNTVAKIERGNQKPEFGTIKNLTKALGLSLEDMPS